MSSFCSNRNLHTCKVSSSFAHPIAHSAGKVKVLNSNAVIATRMEWYMPVRNKAKAIRWAHSGPQKKCLRLLWVTILELKPEMHKLPLTARNFSLGSTPGSQLRFLPLHRHLHAHPRPQPRRRTEELLLWGEHKKLLNLMLFAL